jgi:hypothetical protein
VRVWVESVRQLDSEGLHRITVVPSPAFMARVALHARANGCTVSQLVAEAIAGIVPRERPLDGARSGQGPKRRSDKVT